MPIVWRLNPAELLKEHGYTSYRIRKEKIFGQQSYANLCRLEPVSFEALGKICELTGKQPGKLIAYVPEKELAATKPTAEESDES